MGAGRQGTGVRNQTPSESDGFITNNRWVGVQQAASPCRYRGTDWARLHTRGGQGGAGGRGLGRRGAEGGRGEEHIYL